MPPDDPADLADPAGVVSPGAISPGPVIHKNLRACERSLYRDHPECFLIEAGQRCACACGRVFVHVHDDVEGCYWALQDEIPGCSGTRRQVDGRRHL